MSWLEALILGVIQGLTEFLPVSSSGHLEIGQALLGTASEENLFFTVVVHVATVLATIVVLYKEVGWLLKGTFTTLSWNDEKDYLCKLIVSMIPIFIVGMFFKDQVEELFGSGLLLVGICLLVTAFLLALSDFLSRKRAARQIESVDKSASAESHNIGRSIKYWSAFVVGIAQACAVLPGLSRSGSTIATGLLCGVKKNEIAQFSFLMVLVPVLGEAFLDVVKYIKAPTEMLTTIPVTSLVVGFVSAFITGCLACRFMLKIVRRQKLTYFAVYCLIVGVFAIVYSQC